MVHAFDSLKPAAEYVRMSTDVQVFSLEAQRALIADYAARYGFNIVRSFEDAGKSGITTRRREGLQALLRAVVGDPPFRTILVADVSRWGRYQDIDEAAHYEFLCRQAGINVVYCAEAFSDDGSLASSIAKHLKRAMAAEYSRQLSERVKEGQLRVAKRGDHTGGSAPYGFAREAYDPKGQDKRLLSHGERKGRQDWSVRLVWGSDAEIAVVRRIFRLFVDDLKRPFEISQTLNDAGIPHSKSGPWTTARVKAVLENELVVGVLATERSSGGMGQARKRRLKGDWTRQNVLPAMISKSVFAFTQKRLGDIHAGRVTTEELLQDLRRLLAEHGTLTKPVLDQYARHSTTLYQRRFGSLAASYRAVGFERLQRDFHHVEDSALERINVEAGLRRLLAEEGRISLTLINRVGYLPHATTLIRHFGSMESLYEAVGYQTSYGHMLKASRGRYPERKTRKANEPDH